ncbi:hypothetical protein QQP08_014440 [Theobroma cacao]|nr:hypothetical protein QQP08_014440 [Theobroma cacao]
MQTSIFHSDALLFPSSIQTDAKARKLKMPEEVGLRHQSLGFDDIFNDHLQTHITWQVLSVCLPLWERKGSSKDGNDLAHLAFGRSQ